MLGILGLVLVLLSVVIVWLFVVVFAFGLERVLKAFASS